MKTLEQCTTYLAKVLILALIYGKKKMMIKRTINEHIQIIVSIYTLLLLLSNIIAHSLRKNKMQNKQAKISYKNIHSALQKKCACYTKKRGLREKNATLHEQKGGENFRKNATFCDA